MTPLRSRFLALREHLELPDFPRQDEIVGFEVSLPEEPSSRQLTELRDALLLTSTMALSSLMRAFWMESLCNGAELYEIETMNPHLPLIAYYKFQLYESAAELDWDRSMRHLFGYEKFDKKFKSDQKDISTFARIFGMDMSNLPPIPFELQFHGPHELTIEQQFEYLTTVKTFATKAYERWRQAEASGCDHPFFTVASIDLLLGGFAITVEIVGLIKEIMVLVPVNRLEPPTKTSSSDGSVALWREPLATLLFAACGH